jgi:hypothetical protein
MFKHMTNLYYPPMAFLLDNFEPSFLFPFAGSLFLPAVFIYTQLFTRQNVRSDSDSHPWRNSRLVRANQPLSRMCVCVTILSN